MEVIWIFDGKYVFLGSQKHKNFAMGKNNIEQGREEMTKMSVSHYIVKQ